MKILIIDNYTKHLGDIKNLCQEHTVSVLEWSEISVDSYKQFDLVILSGGSGMSIDKHTVVRTHVAFLEKKSSLDARLRANSN